MSCPLASFFARLSLAFLPSDYKLNLDDYKCSQKKESLIESLKLYYSINKFKLLNQINDAKKFNLDKKNLFTSLIATLEHESK